MYKHRKFIRVALLAALLANIAIIAGYWWNSSYIYLSSGTIALQLIAVARILGLLGVLAALQQFVIIGRIPLLEEAFGQDRLSRLHRITGYITFIFISLHSILIVNGNALLTGKTVPSQYWFMITTYEDINKAVIALLSLYVLVGSSIWIVRKHLKYEWWHLIHFLTYVFIVFAFGHQLQLGTTLSSSTIFQLYWLVLYTIALGTFGFFRFLLPVLHFIKYQFKVSRVVQESQNVISIYITGNNIESFRWKSGQFGIFTFFQKGISIQPHPFSISYAPLSRSEIRITVKDVGDYTKQLQQIKEGARVLVEGPHGVFGQQVEDEPQVLLVAGGIGVTPMCALFERYARNGRIVTLLYSAQTKADLVLKQELDLIAKHFKNADVVYVVEGGQTNSGTLSGRISAELITKYVPGVIGRRAFVCGPPAMMDAITEALVSLGFPKKKIFSERFSFLR